MRVLSSPVRFARRSNRLLRQRAALLLSASSLALGGCQLSRPEGAFDPVYPEEQELNDPNAPAPMDMGDGDGPAVFVDASVEATTDIYKGIVGTYLARFDERSTAVTQVGFGGGISTSSVTSRFFLIRIEEGQNGTLISREQLCALSTDDTCQPNCDTSTKIFSDAAARIPKSRQIVRELAFDEQSRSLYAKGASTFLGYDATDTDRALPTSLEDPRVWRGSGPGREGLYMDLRLTVQVLGAPTSVICQVNMVQELNITWNAKVNSWDDEVPYVLDKAGGFFDSVASTSDILGAVAKPADKHSDCMGKNQDSGDSPKPAVERGLVKFRATSLTSCPQLSVFEKELEPLVEP